MLRQYAGEVRRAALKPVSIVMVVLMSMTGLTMFALSMEGGPSQGLNPPAATYYYYNGYQISVYTAYGTGDPFHGAQVMLTVDSSGGRNLFNLTQTSPSSGISRFDVPVTEGYYTAYLTVASAHSRDVLPPIELAPTPAGLPVAALDNLGQALREGFVEQGALCTFMSGPLGAPPNGYTAGFALLVGKNYQGTPILTKNMTTSLGTLQGYSTIFHVPIGQSVPSSDWVDTELFSPNGSVVARQLFNAAVFQPQTGVVTPEGLAIEYGSTEVAVFLSLLAIVLTFSLYTRDRAEGWFDLVLAQPVGRIFPLAVRFSALVLLVGIGAFGAAGFISLWVRMVTGSPLSLSVTAVLGSSLWAESTAFVGLMLVASHLFKTSTGGLGTGLGLFVLFQLVWTALVDAVLQVAGLAIGSGAFLREIAWTYLLNPVGPATLVGSYFTYTLNGISLPETAYPLVPLPFVVAAAITWIVIPLIAVIYLAARRD